MDFLITDIWHLAGLTRDGLLGYRAFIRIRSILWHLLLDSLIFFRKKIKMKEGNNQVTGIGFLKYQSDAGAFYMIGFYIRRGMKQFT